MSDPTVRLAAAQVAPVFLDRDATVATAVSVIEEAGRAGAQVVAFPETWVPGYPMWIFGAAGWDDPASKRAFARLQANAIEVRARPPTRCAPPRAAPESWWSWGSTSATSRTRAARSTTRGSTLHVFDSPVASAG
jgi:hypothetical protein